MIGNLPRKFTEKMEKLLGGEYDKFMSSYDAQRVYGLRINRLKLGMEEWMRLSPFGSEARDIPWAEGGLYYKEGDRPGKHPHYHAGLYYIQEPSAMAPAELLDVKPGHRVLDLCAAPGGKSTQLAAKLQGKGVLVANDNARERTKALAKNIELAGVRNAVVLNEEPASLAPVFAEWFDRILVDAPCSGEGMFRKDESMIADWEKHSVERCSAMQRDIMRHAAAMLAPGGLLVYSTCTFSPEENEQQIADFLAEHPDFSVLPIPCRYGWAPGRADLVDKPSNLDEERLRGIEGTVRLWPHRIEGEGHFAALLRRGGEADRAERGGAIPIGGIRAAASVGQAERSALKRDSGRGGGRPNDRRAGKISGGKGGDGKPAGEEDPIAMWLRQAGQFVAASEALSGRMIAYGSKVYIQPEGLPSLDGLRVVRPGWYVGEAARGRIVPTQPLAMGLKREEALRSVNWSSDDLRTLRYLKGETLFAEETEIQSPSAVPAKGYVLVCADGFPIGWGKYDGGMIKNELPAGWRQA
ncbi:RsmB/NOP family class I SAM-dependent RNA methyltransferase [Paenibacillus arenilitoris]|uniref:RsmB/NOP family class I SAM-dependent RNA methyltransferase n=1 Tax=Paenibacillus arenilitoris TaxID=2772299 RepID=A0A927CT93_9BACL|nr:RsmB/NOP family class I SAM-dependent RNA methyltransferase [Paenibacillus arenilitoris]MBD2872812.1 RsmB/NOP family class I SAM-dependent RNA methyltransferase [Paenibacillus arenilitoris]